jgi:ElaB/YqjD/DUF883 family membrane-anchored ribosome-binding protein
MKTPLTISDQNEDEREELYADVARLRAENELLKMGAVPDYKTAIEELNKADAENARLRAENERLRSENERLCERLKAVARIAEEFSTIADVPHRQPQPPVTAAVADPATYSTAQGPNAAP